MPAIELDGLTKRFGAVTALQDVTLAVEHGCVFGFLGPNGAGKSTTIDVLLDYVRPTAGTARVFGVDAQQNPAAVRARVGVLTDSETLFGHWTARHHLRFAIDSKDATDDPDALLERVGLTGAADRPASDYSKGMKQRLALAMALVDAPDLLILDEPSTGLDPNGARRMREIVRAERDRGATVFFSSHILDQVEAVADRVGILNEGRLIAENTVEGLRETVGTQATLRLTVGGLTDAAVAAVEAVEGVTNARRAEDADTADVLAVTCPDAAKADVIDAVRTDGATVADVETAEASLDELFAAYTEGGRDGTGRDGTSRDATGRDATSRVTEDSDAGGAPADDATGDRDSSAEVSS